MNKNRPQPCPIQLIGHINISTHFSYLSPSITRAASFRLFFLSSLSLFLLHSPQSPLHHATSALRPSDNRRCCLLRASDFYNFILGYTHIIIYVYIRFAGENPVMRARTDKCITVRLYRFSCH